MTPSGGSNRSEESMFADTTSAAIDAARLSASRHRREKVFGEGRLRPLDRNAKVRIMVLARALSHRTEKGKAYGEITAKFLAVLEALLLGFHNAVTGRCFPSYERLAERARCARSTVYEAIRALERVGLLTWVNRICRVREWSAEPDLYGQPTRRVRVLRTSNAYTFNDPKPSKSDFPTGTRDQGLNLPSVDAWDRQKRDRTPLRGEHARGLEPDPAFLARMAEHDRSIRTSRRAAEGQGCLAAAPNPQI